MTVTTILTVLVISVIALNSYVYLNPGQEEVAQDTQPKETPGITAALGPPDKPQDEPENEPEPEETPPPETDEPTSPGEAPDPRLPDEPDRPDGPKKTKPSESPTTGPTTKALPELPCLMGSHNAADINDLMVSFRGRWREKTISDKRWATQEGIRHYKREPQQKEYNVTVTNIIGNPDIGITITGACKASVKISSMWKVTLSHNHTLISSMDIARTNGFYCSKTNAGWSCTF